jgi:serine/threonine protein kinase
VAFLSILQNSVSLAPLSQNPEPRKLEVPDASKFEESQVKELYEVARSSTGIWFQGSFTNRKGYWFKAGIWHLRQLCCCQLAGFGCVVQTYHELNGPAKYGLTSDSKEYVEAVNKFTQEIMRHSTLIHENIVPFSGVVLAGESKLPKYLVTKAPACSLAKLLATIELTSHPLSREEYLSVCEDILRGLSYLEEVRGIHRNIKPGSIFVFSANSELQMKIGDFALLLVEPIVADLGSSGTLHYMAPEVEASELYDSRADVFSFGVMMAEIFLEYVVEVSPKLPLSRDAATVKACEKASRLATACPFDSDERAQYGAIEQLLTKCCMFDLTVRCTAKEALKIIDRMVLCNAVTW